MNALCLDVLNNINRGNQHNDLFDRSSFTPANGILDRWYYAHVGNLRGSHRYLDCSADMSDHYYGLLVEEVVNLFHVASPEVYSGRQ